MNAAQFDATIQSWVNYQASPRGRLRMALLMRALEPLIPSQPADVLDIGTGFGEVAASLAQRGHRVTACDYAEGMLAAARERLVHLPIRVQRLDLGEDDALLAPQSFDLIVCHNVLEYVPDPAAAIARLARALRPGAWLSLAFGNAHFAPLQSVLVHNDVPRAMRELQQGAPETTNIFGTQTHVLALPQVQTMLAQHGLQLRRASGIRCVADLLRADHVDDAQLLALEQMLMQQPAYAQIARFIHLDVVKP